MTRIVVTPIAFSTVSRGREGGEGGTTGDPLVSGAAARAHPPSAQQRTIATVSSRTAVSIRAVFVPATRGQASLSGTFRIRSRRRRRRNALLDRIMASNNQARPLIGAHVSIAGGVSQSLARGRQIGCDCIQIFTKSSRQWASKPYS